MNFTMWFIETASIISMLSDFRMPYILSITICTDLTNMFSAFSNCTRGLFVLR